MDKFRQWLQRTGYRMQTAMAGRYGYDELSQAMTLAALVSVIVGLFAYPGFFCALSLILYILAFFRMYSKNTAKRRKELEAYYRLANPVKAWFSRHRRMFAERKTHRYFRCSQCGTSLRVPRGKGKIKIRCPKCGAEIIKKT